MQEVNKIKGYRNMTGLSQEDMAKKLNMAAKTYAMKESNVDKFNVKEVKALIKVLAEHNVIVTANDLF